jgi:hypothetical protein
MTSPTDAAVLQFRLSAVEKKLEALIKITSNLLKEYDANHERHTGKCSNNGTNHTGEAAAAAAKPPP